MYCLIESLPNILKENMCISGISVIPTIVQPFSADAGKSVKILFEDFCLTTLGLLA